MKAKFPIVKNFKIFALISVVFIAAGLIGLVTAPFGLTLFNLDIDFVGGTSIYFDMGKQVDTAMISEVRTVLKDSVGVEASAVQSAGEGNELIVKTVDIGTEQRATFVDAMQAKFGLTDESVLNIDNVSASVGRDLQKAALNSVVIASVLMLIYITIRFSFLSGLASVVCLIHDVLIMLSAYVIFKIPMNLNFIAAALIIFGYSINASIITFDRIRENSKYAKRENPEDVVERSIWQTMTRSIYTTFTTLITIVLVYIMGVPSLQNFALPIIIGIVSGAYSSVFIAGPMWCKLQKMADNYKAKKRARA